MAGCAGESCWSKSKYKRREKNRSQLSIWEKKVVEIMHLALTKWNSVWFIINSKCSIWSDSLQFESKKVSWWSKSKYKRSEKNRSQLSIWIREKKVAEIIYFISMNQMELRLAHNQKEMLNTIRFPPIWKENKH